MGLVSSKLKTTAQTDEQYTYETFFNQNRVGPSMGIYYRFANLEFISLESGLNYLQKGGEAEIMVTTPEQIDGTGEYIVADVQYDYLQLEVNMRPYYEIGKYDLYGIIGASLNYLLSVKNGRRPKNEIKEFTLSYSLGFGIEIKDIFNHSILLEFLYNSDLTNVYKDSDLEYKFNTYVLRVGFGILN